MALSIIHSFVNIFAGGKNDIRIVLFVVYFAFLIITYFFLRKNSPKIFKWHWIGITLLVMYVYGLCLHIFYLLSNNLSLIDMIITGNNGEISTSTIWHTHIAKGTFGQIFSFLGKTQLQTMDAGGAYIGLIPSWIFLIGLILFVALVLQTIYYFIYSFKPLLSNKNVRQKIFLITGYAIASFALIKTSIDGGMFNYSFSISLIFLALFIFKIKGGDIKPYYYIISLTGVILLFTGLYIDLLVYGNGLDIEYAATLLVLYYLLLYGGENEIHLKFFIPLLVLFTIGWFVASSRDRDIYAYSSKMLTQGQLIYTYNDKLKEVKTSRVTKPETVMDMSNSLGKNITYMPITAPGINCMEKAPQEEFSVTLISSKQITQNRFISSPYLQIKNENSTPHQNGKWKTELLVFTDSCLPDLLSAIDGMLQKNNITTYLLVNPIHITADNNTHF